MADLIEQESGKWKTQVIKNSFLPFEVQQIKAIPLCASAQSDSLYWSWEKNGVYLVKSGYKLIFEDSRSEAASGSTRSGVSGLCLGFGNSKCLEKSNTSCGKFAQTVYQLK